MGNKILIVDDDVETIRLIGLMLERKGYQIVAAATGAQGLEKASQLQPDLIILDVMMPDLDGYEVTRRIRECPELQNIPIIMFTAKSAITDKVAGFHSGVDDYLTKPVHPTELLTRIEALLARSAARRAATAPAAPVETRRGHLVAFLPSKGGVGNTTLAVNATIEINRLKTGKKTLLIEFPTGGASMALQLNLSPHNSLQTLVERNAISKLDLETINGQIQGHPTGIRLLPSTPQPAGITPPLTEEFTRSMLRLLLAEYDIVMADLPPTLDPGSREVLRQADFIVLSLEPSRIGLALAREMIEKLEQFNIGKYKVGLVMIHRTPAASSLNRTAVESALNQTLLSSIPPVPELVTESYETGRPVILMQPQSLISQQIRMLVEAFKNTL